MLTLLAMLLSLAFAQDPSPPVFVPPGAAPEVIDLRYDALLRELVASASGRAFLDALMVIDREYLYATDLDELLRGATAGVIEALDDPYSRYLEPAKVAARRAGVAPETEVDKALLGDIGYVRVPSFDGDVVGARLSSAVEAHLANGALGLVLDLRGNAGGSILQGLQVLDRFLADGVLGFRRVRGVSVPIAYANPRSVTNPLVVLVDAGTASTAEIVAGALQAYGRAQLVGTVTAGKGIGQTAVELSDGSEVQLVSFEWLLPGFRSIDGTGLRPDVEIDEMLVDDDGLPRQVKSIQDVASDAALRAALELLRGLLGDELSAPMSVPAPVPYLGPTILPLDEDELEEPPAQQPPAEEPAMRPVDVAPPRRSPGVVPPADVPSVAPPGDAPGDAPPSFEPIEVEPLQIGPTVPEPREEAAPVEAAPVPESTPGNGDGEGANGDADDDPGEDGARHDGHDGAGNDGPGRPRVPRVGQAPDGAADDDER